MQVRFLELMKIAKSSFLTNQECNKKPLGCFKGIWKKKKKVDLSYTYS